MAIATLNYQYYRPLLYAKQEAALFDPARISVIEASTKSGKSVAALVWLAEQAMTARDVPNPTYTWVAPVYRQAEEIGYQGMLNAFPAGMLESNRGRLTHTLPNGAVVAFRSGENPENLYGFANYAAVIDEASRLREESWHATRTTLSATEGPIRIIGNVRGRKNWFYRLARRAEAGEPGLAYHRITALDAIHAGVLSEEDVAEAKRVLPKEAFDELYMTKATDAGANPFGHEHIEACTVPALSDGVPVVWGWDLAKSVDWTVGIALDAKRRVCRFLRFQMPWMETMKTIAQETGTARALVDSTGVGDPILENLQRGHSNYEGYHFTQGSKQQLMEGLAVAIQQRLLAFPDGPILLELKDFEYTYTRTGVLYSAPEGAHDDCVDALGLANRHFKEMPASTGRAYRLERTA